MESLYSQLDPLVIVFVFALIGIILTLTLYVGQCLLRYPPYSYKTLLQFFKVPTFIFLPVFLVFLFIYCYGPHYDDYILLALVAILGGVTLTFLTAYLMTLYRLLTTKLKGGSTDEA